MFKENASVVKANADAAFKTAGLSANEYMSQVTSFSASLLSSLGGDTAKAAEVADMAMIDMADNAIGHSMNVEIVKLEIERFIIEALMVNPYIKRLDNFIFENTSTGMTVSFDCTSIYGSNTILVPVREVRV